MVMAKRRTKRSLAGPPPRRRTVLLAATAAVAAGSGGVGVGVRGVGVGVGVGGGAAGTITTTTARRRRPLADSSSSSSSSSSTMTSPRRIRRRRTRGDGNYPRRRRDLQEASTTDPPPPTSPSPDDDDDDDDDEASPERWFPNWSKVASAGNVCLSDAVHARPSYMTDESLLKDSPEECCEGYYWWDLAVCLAGAGIIATGNNDGDGGDGDDVGGGGLDGSGEWYADYGSFTCARDCPEEDGDNCGGVVMAAAAVDGDDDEDDAMDLYATAEACCGDEFSYRVLGLCAAESTGTEYEGTERYYVDYQYGRCVQDCPIMGDDDGEEGMCGGVVRESHTETYADAASCCAARLSYVDGLLCETRSREGGAEDGTFRLYPDLISNTCVIDKDPSHTNVCGIGYTCKLLPSSSWVPKLYPVSPTGVEECCSEGLSYVSPGYCKTRTMGIVSRKWFANYEEKRCRQDCEDESDSTCALNEEPAAELHDSAEQCCSNKLGFRNQAKCLADSTDTPYEGTGQYYVDYRGARCVADCPLEDGGDCGGVVEDVSNRLYADVAACCAAGLSYMDAGLCEARSDHASTGTGRYYLSEEDSACVKDTSATPCPTGETCKRVEGWIFSLFDTIDQCCQSAATLAIINGDYCEAFSMGVGTERWFRLGGDRCARHCTVAGSSEECGVPGDPHSVHHATAEACCAAELDYLNLNTCTELSENGGILSDLVGTEEFYVDWIQQKCVKNCPEGNGLSCGGIAGGKWMQLFAEVGDCCDFLHYIDRSECVKA